ncbi:MAG: sigma-70 family RNA polymerase sigma factor [Bacteroidetes bacterium]|nr:sigma-70 family RNA polymerase sigma factor [Bacteroidota bacterium]MBL6963952.1 sigma-70 family RNA polymerase sigma factor [Bacteroidota bacterium]
MAKKSYFSDEDIIKGILNNENWSLNVLYKVHYAMIFNLIVNNNGSSQEAKDIYQESIIIFYNNIRSSDFKLDCKIKTYLYSVARRLWLNELKYKYKIVGNLNDFEEVIEFDKSDLDNLVENERKLKLMNTCLAELGEPCNTILREFYMNKVSMSEIAKLMGYTNSDNAKNQKYKCLQRLKKLFFAKEKKTIQNN